MIYDDRSGVYLANPVLHVDRHVYFVLFGAVRRYRQRLVGPGWYDFLQGLVGIAVSQSKWGDRDHSLIDCGMLEVTARSFCSFAIQGHTLHKEACVEVSRVLLSLPLAMFQSASCGGQD